MVFSNNQWNLDHIYRLIHTTSIEFSSIDRKHIVGLRRRAWSSPTPPFVKLNVDGSYIPSTYLMGISGLIQDDLERWIYGFSHAKGRPSPSW